MTGQAHTQIKIARRSAAFPRFALPGDAEALAVAHAGGNLDFVILGDRNLAGAAAIRTDIAALDAGAAAIGANGVAPEGDGSDSAVHNLLQRDHQNGFYVMASIRLGFGKTLTPGGSASAAKKLLEKITETGAVEFKRLAPWLRAGLSAVSAIKRAAGRRPETGSILPIGAQLVVFLAFVRVGQDFVGLIDDLKFFLGGLLVFVLGHVGVVLAGQGAEGLADFVGTGGARNTESLIIIFVFNRHNLWVTGLARLAAKGDFYCGCFPGRNADMNRIYRINHRQGHCCPDLPQSYLYFSAKFFIFFTLICL